MKKFMRFVILKVSPFHFLVAFYTLIAIIGVIYRIVRSRN
jgi:hypothetical protein